MQTNPKAALLVVDPNQTDRWIEMRGRVATITTDGAILHRDMLAHRYLNKQHFDGDVDNVEWQHHETRVIARIEPVKVTLDAIFR